MFREYYPKIDYTTVAVILATVFALLVQLLLCFKAKKLLTKLVPVIMLAVSAAAFAVCSACIGGWDGIGYLFFFLLSAWLLLMCGLGWGFWAMIRGRKK